MATSVRPYVDALGLQTPIIGYQGGLVRDVRAARPARAACSSTGRSPRAPAREAIEWSTANGFRPHVNHLERFIVAADDPNVEDYSKFLGARAEVVADTGGLGPPPGDEGHRGRRVGPAGGAARAGPGPLRRPGGRDGQPSRVHRVRRAGRLQGPGVRWFARRNGVPLEQVLAIGDQHNDTSMLSIVGHGVAMRSAPDDVRAASLYVAPGVEEEGAAQVLEALVLAGQRMRHGTPSGSASRGLDRDRAPPPGRRARPQRRHRRPARRRHRRPADRHGLRDRRRPLDARRRGAPLRGRSDRPPDKAISVLVDGLDQVEVLARIPRAAASWARSAGRAA